MSGLEKEVEEDVEDESCGEEGAMRSEDPRKVDADKNREFVRKLADPKLPSEEERKMHWLQGHYPYRNWCEVCVKAMGREMGHRPEDKERVVPEYSFDYCFPGDELGYKWTVLVGKERESGAYMGTAVPNT